MSDDKIVSTPDPPTRTHPAVYSLFLPGLGQFLQKRDGAGFVQLLLYLFTVAAPLSFVVYFFARTPFHYSQVFVLALFSSIFPLYIVFFSVLDAVYWKPAGSSGLITRLSKIVLVPHLFFYVFLCLPILDGGHREAVRSIFCRNNMHAIANALFQYHEEHHSLPPAYTVDADGNPLHSWRVLILPYFNRQDGIDLYKQIRLDEPWDSEYNKQFHSQMPGVFRCRSIEKHNNLQDYAQECRCCYSVVIGKETPFPGSETTTRENISDAENTILVAERMSPVNWMNPMGDIPFETASCGINAEPTGIGSGHSGGCNCTLADGSSRFIRDTNDSKTLKKMLSRRQ